MIIALLVGRQILTVRENVSLTRDLEHRVYSCAASSAGRSCSKDVVTLVEDGRGPLPERVGLRHFTPASSIKGHPISNLFTDEGAIRQTLARHRTPAVTIVEPVRHSSGRLCERRGRGRQPAHQPEHRASS